MASQTPYRHLWVWKEHSKSSDGRATRSQEAAARIPSGGSERKWLSCTWEIEGLRVTLNLLIQRGMKQGERALFCLLLFCENSGDKTRALCTLG